MHSHRWFEEIVSMATCPQNSRKKRRRVVVDGDKEARKQNFMKKIFEDDKATKTASFHKRKPTLKKKALELHTLCDVPVCIVCFGPNGSVDVWPEDKQCAKELIMSYKRSGNQEKKESNVLELMQGKKKKLQNKKQEVKINGMVSTLTQFLDGLSRNLLIDKVNELEDKIKSFKERIEVLRMEKKRKRIQIVADDDEKISPVPSVSYTPNYPDVNNNLLWPTNPTWSNLAMAGSYNHFVVEDDIRSNVLLNNNNNNGVPHMTPENFGMLENGNNYMIPFDYQHQMSYIHHVLPLSVWKPSLPRGESVGSNESSNVVSSNWFPSVGSQFW